MTQENQEMPEPQECQDILLTGEDFEARGYRRFVDGYRKGQFYEGSWQLRIRDEIGTRYFVTVTGYRFPDQPVRFSANIQFHEQERFTGSTFNIDRNVSAGIQETEEFFARMWSGLKLDYYERYNEHEGVPLADLPVHRDDAPKAPAKVEGTPWHDREDDMTAAVAASHPTLTGRHDLYQRAMRLVGNRHGKGALVGLVNHLLATIDAAKMPSKGKDA